MMRPGAVIVNHLILLLMRGVSGHTLNNKYESALSLSIINDCCRAAKINSVMTAFKKAVKNLSRSRMI